MAKQPGKLTRAEKLVLAKLDDDLRTAAQIKAGADVLDALAARGLARSVLDVGLMRYRITPEGRAKLPAIPADEQA